MRVPLFDCATIYFCQSAEEVEDFCKQADAAPIDLAGINGLSTRYINTKTGERMILIAVLNGEIPTLAHEASHAVFSLCEMIGVDVEVGKSNETFCYLVSAIMKFALKHMEKPV